jgi:hypothetical protein
MLDFVEANFKHELGEQFYGEFEELIDSAQGVGSARIPDPANAVSAPIRD